MTDGNSQTDLALPDRDLGKNLWIAIETAQREADFAREMLVDADNPEEASRSLTILNTRLNELAQIGQVAAEALAVVSDVAKQLKAQRDEAIQERDALQETAEETALEIADELTSEWLQWNLQDTVDEEMDERDHERHYEEKSAVEGLQGLGMTDEAQALQQALEMARKAKAEADEMLDKTKQYLDENGPEATFDEFDADEENNDWNED